MEKIAIKTDFIKLDALLKFSNIAESGGFAKLLIKEGMVRLNGEVVLQRGKKIYPEDIVEVIIPSEFDDTSADVFQVQVVKA